MVVRVSMRDDDMRNGWPFFFGDQATEIEHPQVLSGVYHDPCVALINQERVIQVVGDPH